MGISMESTEWLLLHCFQVELEFGNVGFCGGRKTGVPGSKKTLGARTRTNDKLEATKLTLIMIEKYYNINVSSIISYRV